MDVDAVDAVTVVVGVVVVVLFACNTALHTTNPQD